MKKIFTLSAIAVVITVAFTACVKERISFDESYWLSQENGTVVYSSNSCSYFVVQTNYGYDIIRTQSGYKPYENDIMYGNFGNYGTRDFYDRTDGVVFTAEVIEYDLSYADAQAALNYYCN